MKEQTHLPLVSVITLTHNRAHLLSRAIQSVLNQSYRNIEYILVDGASTDNTREVVSSFADSRIKYFYREENDITENINYGVKQAIGKYVTFLDDDDEYKSQKIEKQLILIENLSEDYGLVYCWMDYFDNQTGKFLNVHKSELRGYVGEEVVDSPKVSGTPTLMIRKEVFDRVGYWRGDIGLLKSDWELCARICQLYKVDFVPEALVNVYVNHGSPRMSCDLYKDKIDRGIIFHKQFLSTYKSIFEKVPRKATLHLYNLSCLCFLSGRIKEGWIYYKQLLQVSFTIKNLLLFPYYSVKRFLRK